MLAHFEQIASSKNEDARVVAFNSLIKEIFPNEEVCGTHYSEDKMGYRIITTTPENKYEFMCEYEWGVMLSRTNNPGYRIRECWYVTLNEATITHKVNKNGRLQRVD